MILFFHQLQTLCQVCNSRIQNLGHGFRTQGSESELRVGSPNLGHTTLALAHGAACPYRQPMISAQQ